MFSILNQKVLFFKRHYTFNKKWYKVYSCMLTCFVDVHAALADQTGNKDALFSPALSNYSTPPTKNTKTSFFSKAESKESDASSVSNGITPIVQEPQESNFATPQTEEPIPETSMLSIPNILVQNPAVHPLPTFTPIQTREYPSFISSQARSLRSEDNTIQDHLLAIHQRINELERRSVTPPLNSSDRSIEQHIRQVHQRLGTLERKMETSDRAISPSHHDMSERLMKEDRRELFDEDLYSEAEKKELSSSTKRNSSISEDTNVSILNNASSKLCALSPEALSRVKSDMLMMSPVNAIRVLALDGGGIRGILELYFLALLEAETKMHTTEIFHLMGGTSVGGQITALLNLKDKNTRRPKYTAQFLLDYLLKSYPYVFKTKWHTLFGLIGEKYKTGPFKKVLEDLAGDDLYQDGVIPTFATAYDLSSTANQKLTTFYSKDKTGISVKDVVLSTTAAPGYFKSHLAANGKEYIDGGLIANNPTHIAINLAHREFGHASNIILVSLGTGFFPDVKEEYPSLKHVPLWNIAKKIPHFFLKGQQALIEESLLYRPDVVRFRFNPKVKGESIALDNATKENIMRLKEAAIQAWIDNKETIEAFKRMIPARTSNQDCEI